MKKTKIEWTDATWNVITGCSKISPGCTNCYAERMAKRLAGRCGYPKQNSFQVTFHKDRINLPLQWRKPLRIFVNSMGDLFHEDVDIGMLTRVFDVMYECKQHTFLILTKRPERIVPMLYEAHGDGWRYMRKGNFLKNVWFGVTAENQEQADKRTYILRNIPCSVRFVSVEPMLSPVTLEFFDYRINWVICGGETGPGARSIKPEWIRSLRDQCSSAAVPFFFKGWGTGQETGCGLKGHPMFEAGWSKKGQVIDGKIWHEFPQE